MSVSKVGATPIAQQLSSTTSFHVVPADSGLQRTALVASISIIYIHLCSFSLLGECSYHTSITSASLLHSAVDSAIQSDYFQKLPNRKSGYRDRQASAFRSSQAVTPWSFTIAESIYFVQIVTFHFSASGCTSVKSIFWGGGI